MVVDAGTDVTRFKKGDQVFGVSNVGLGTHAEFKCLPEDGVVALKPANMSYEEASGLPEALTALYFLRDLANIRQGLPAPSAPMLYNWPIILGQR